MGETYFQEFAPNFFMGGPHVGPTHLGPTWAHPLGPHVGPPTWAQAPAPAAPAPADEFSDPNLTPLPTHPGMKYVARTLAATSEKRTPKEFQEHLRRHGDGWKT